jgi:catechol 2,3-dioxygenase-like lactoylglutathione lyase family enzyme
VTLQHVSLEVRAGDVEAELRFWGLLGFEPVDPPGRLGERSAWVQAGASQVHLLFTADPVVAEGHVAVVAADYPQTLQRLSEAGIEIDERTAHWGARRCFVRSPAGHRVEVMAAPPAPG